MTPTGEAVRSSIPSEALEEAVAEPLATPKADAEAETDVVKVFPLMEYETEAVALAEPGREQLDGFVTIEAG